nr:reverse transcriptase domain-containing protein [Tanacetum cinerariifolium]
MIIQIFYRGLDDPTQGILEAGRIFLYNTPNEAFKILEDMFLLKLDFSKDSQNTKPKTIVLAVGNNINSNHAIIMEKFKALASKIDSEFLIIRNELKETRDGRRDNYASQIYMKDDMLMCKPHEANYDCTVHIPYTQEKVFKHDEILNHVGDKELISFVGIRNEVLKGNIEDTENPGRPNVSPSLVEYIPKIPYPQALKREISHLNHVINES